MKIKILGTKANIKAGAPGHTKHSGVLVDNKLLFDIGEKEFLKYNPSYIFFTHFHPDHAWFVRGNGEKVKLNAICYVPEKTALIEGNVQAIEKSIKLNEYKITPVPTIHSISVKSQGYVIEKDEKRIFYSGDVAWIEKRHYPLLKNLDLVITEGSHFRKGGMIQRHKTTGAIFGHTGIPNLVHLFKPFTRRIILTHFGSWFMKDLKEAEERIKALEEDNLIIEIAIDGKDFEV